MAINPVTGIDDTLPEQTTITGASTPAIPTQGTVSQNIPNATNVSNTPAGNTPVIPKAVTASPTNATINPVIKNPNALQSGVKGTIYDTGNGEMSDGTTLKNPADQGGFGSGIDYTGTDKGNATVGTGTVANSTVSIPVDNTKPHSQGDVWNGQTGNWELPGTTPTNGTNSDSIIKSMERAGGTMTADEKRAVTSALNSLDPATALKMTAEQRLRFAKDQLSASRLKRDTEQKLSYDQQQYDLQTAQYKQQMDTQTNRQRTNIDATVNNLSMALGTSGRLQSRRATNAAKTAIDQQTTIFNNMISTRDNALTQMANTLKYNQKAVSDNYNDQVSKAMQDAMSKIEALNKTGSLDTAQGLIQARDYIDKVNTDYLQHTTNYANQLTAMSGMYTQTLEQNKINKTVDENVTKTMNDGYLYNTQGTRVTDEQGQSIKVQGSTAGTLLTKDPITMTDGSKAFIYQNRDGSTRVEKIQGTEAPKYEIPAEAIRNYADLISQGKIKPEDLTKLGLSPEQVINVLAQTQASQNPELKEINGKIYQFQIDPNTGTYKQVGEPIGETNDKFQSVILKDADGNETPATFNQTKGTYNIHGRNYSGSQVASSGLSTGKIAPATINGKGFKEGTGTSLLNAIDPTGTLLKRMTALGMQEGGLTFDDENNNMRTNQALVVDKTTGKLVRGPDTGLDIGTFQMHGKTADEAWAKFNDNLAKGVNIAKQYGIDIADPNTMSNQDKQIIAHIGYIGNRSANALSAFADPDIKGPQLASLVEKIQGSVKGSGNNFLNKLDSITETAGTTSISPKQDEYNQVAQELIDGKTKISDLKTLYKKSEIDKIQQAKLDLEKNQKEDNKPILQSPQDFENLTLNPKATADQNKSLQYGNRMNYASEKLISLENKFANRTYLGQEFQTYAPNVLKSDEQQQLESAKQNFITATLRQESGAAISPTEFIKEETKYFPVAGDSKATILEKQKAREFGIKAMYGQAGKDDKGVAVSSYYVPKNIYEDGSYIKYDNAGNYNYVNKDGKESGWKPVGQDNSKQEIKPTAEDLFNKYYTPKQK